MKIAKCGTGPFEFSLVRSINTKAIGQNLRDILYIHIYIYILKPFEEETFRTRICKWNAINIFFLNLNIIPNLNNSSRRNSVQFLCINFFLILFLFISFYDFYFSIWLACLIRIERNIVDDDNKSIIGEVFLLLIDFWSKCSQTTARFNQGKFNLVRKKKKECNIRNKVSGYWTYMMYKVIYRVICLFA